MAASDKESAAATKIQRAYRSHEARLSAAERWDDALDQTALKVHSSQAKAAPGEAYNSSQARWKRSRWAAERLTASDEAKTPPVPASTQQQQQHPIEHAVTFSEATTMKDKMKAAKRYAYAKGKGKEQADQTLRVKKELEAQHWVRLRHPLIFLSSEALTLDGSAFQLEVCLCKESQG